MRPIAGSPLPLLSIVIPVYNEIATVQELLTRVISHEVRGVEREFIIVESNSTDGTREAVAPFAQQRGVTCVWQERPRGKGHAVREGLGHARGDIILIQDADLEYDVQDYQSLLDPILNGDTMFVLGSRHTNGWKMRQFEEAPLMAAFMNAGHVFFRSLVNVVCGQRLKDPFTMYKVFRHECLTGVHLTCDRFDLDIELLIKLVRNGFVPLEVPVRYRSRPFTAGKKIVIWRDPWTWMWAALRSAFGPL